MSRIKVFRHHNSGIVPDILVRVAYTWVMTQAPSTQPTKVLDDAARQRALLGAHPALERLSGRYEVRREIGSGGMGYVFEARDRETGEVLALKVLRPEIAADPAMAERFKNELRLARRITHKNVCRIYDFNRVDSLAYISMEYVEGITLRTQLDGAGAMPTARVITIARQIASGLGEAHAQGIVHRDLKPENIMITGSGAVKLMDFGIARTVHGASNATQTLIGTPAYMSPEQVQGHGVDARSDIYALGLVLYECLSGRRAFAAPTPVAIALKQVQERPSPLRSVRPDIPRAVEAAVMRCIEKDPSRRFASVAELASALAQSFSATGVVPVERARRWPWIVAAMATLSMGALVWHKHTNVVAPLVVATTPAATVPAPIRSVASAHPQASAPGSERRAELSTEREDKRHERKAAFAQLQTQAQTGDAQAQFRLGMLYASGPAAIRDETRAKLWVERAAEQNYADAQFNLALMYETGRGVDRDVPTALSWYQRAAANGHDGAQKALARLNERTSVRRSR